MLSVILTILKIIGIIILLILGLFLLILLLVLFVPIRYRIRASYGEAFLIDGGVSWLFHIIHGRIKITDQDNRVWIRLFGFLFYDSTKEKSESKTKGKSKERRLNSKKVNISSNNEDLQEKQKSKAYEQDIKQASEQDIKQASEQDVKQASEQVVKPDDNQDIKQDETVNKKSFIMRLKLKIIAFFKRIKLKIKNFFKKLFSIKHKVSLIISFIRNEINKEAFRITFASLIKLIKHILPRKFNLKLLFGTGDPCSTGQALGVLSILYSFYGDKIEITPDFENKVLKGSFFAKGRIRIWTILIIVIKLLLDERFKKFKMNYQRLKEEF